jgi:hypothetical protein
MRNTFLRKLTDDERNVLYIMMDDDKAAGYTVEWTMYLETGFCII